MSLARIADLGSSELRFARSQAPQAPPTDGSRDRLTADELLASAYKGDSPVHNNYFLPIGKAAAGPARLQRNLDCRILVYV